MTVVVEGKMSIQFYTQSEDGLIADGHEVILRKGDTGYVKAGRIHDAKYLEDCKLVYVHDNAFGFTAVNN
jgi:mannose-6-phosphate isomerase-like protein (cupin superfamily)